MNDEKTILSGGRILTVRNRGRSNPAFIVQACNLLSGWVYNYRFTTGKIKISSTPTTSVVAIFKIKYQ